jgi:CheY-like chemotaxis protein
MALDFNQRLVEQLLRRAGYDILVASDGRHALAALEKGRFDVMLLDVHMPVCDGFQVIEDQRQREVVVGPCERAAWAADRAVEAFQPSQNASARMTSPPARVIRARNMLRLIVLLKKRTEPSAIDALKPPGWDEPAPLVVGTIPRLVPLKYVVKFLLVDGRQDGHPPAQERLAFFIEDRRRSFVLAGRSIDQNRQDHDHA